MSLDAEFDTLCDAVLDGRGDDAQRARLQEILRDDPSARAEYARQARVHALLTWQSGSGSVVVGKTEEPEIVNPSRWQHRALAIAAMVTLFAGAIGWLATRQSAPQGVAFEVLAADGIARFVAGESASAERIELAEGAITFRLESGAVVEANAPIVLELHDSMHMTVLSGAVTVDVGDEAHGFIVDTANARVVDLGTRFGVSVGEGDTDVVVLEGEVEVYKPSTSAPESRLANLVGGEAVRVDSQWVAQRLAAVAINGESLAILGGNGKRDPIVTRVSDSINDVGFHRFYSIHPHGMREGMRAYTTLGLPQWLSVPDKKFPGRLVGADLVRTFSADRKDSELHLTLEISEPATVYILLDGRSKAPDWLTDGFEKIRQRVRSGPWNPRSKVVEGLTPFDDGEIYVEYSIWSRRMEAAGTVELGPPRTDDDPLERAMYGIAVKRIP